MFGMFEIRKPRCAKLEVCTQFLDFFKFNEDVNSLMMINCIIKFLGGDEIMVYKNHTCLHAGLLWN
jgi:hypothetical protein